MKKKILICSVLPPLTGGIATWVSEVRTAEKILENFEVKEFDLSNSANVGVVLSTAKRLKTGFVLNFRKIFGYFNAMIGVDVVHINSSGGLSHIRDIVFLLIGKFLGKKAVLQLHFGCADRRYKWIPAGRALIKVATFLADKVLVYDLDIVEFLGINNAQLVINGIESSDISVFEKKRQVIYGGWMIEEKGVFELLNAWRSMDKKDGWKMVLAGPASPEALLKLNSIIEIDETITYLGHVSRDEFRNQLNQSAIFALPSHTEGLPYAVLEGMDASCCLIVSKVGGLKEILKEDPLVGYSGDDNLLNVLKTAVSGYDEVILRGLNSKNLLKKTYNKERFSIDLIKAWSF